jgi:hypothetical protein
MHKSFTKNIYRKIYIELLVVRFSDLLLTVLKGTLRFWSRTVLTDNSTMIAQRMHPQPAAATTWEMLSPTSFHSSLYIPYLKLSVTAGAFIKYSRGAADKAVGRIVEVVSSFDLLPTNAAANHPLVNSPLPAAFATTNIPIQFAKVNLFIERSHIDDENHTFPLSSTDTGFESVVQMQHYEWIVSHLVLGLAFVFLEENTSSSFMDDCRGMKDLFLVKYRITSVGEDVSVIPQNSFPPFAGQLEGFRNMWSVDHCEMIFNSIRSIRHSMQQILCRVAQSQGDWAVKNVKLHVPTCSWHYIVTTVAGEQGILNRSILRPALVKYSQPRSRLLWGLTYHTSPYTGNLQVLRFDTTEKMETFRRVFGKTAGYGLRKKRPKYSDGKSFLCLNDVMNVLLCCRSQEEEEEEEAGRGSGDNNSDCSHDEYQSFQRFGVTEDGIDLSYDASDGVLQIVVRYRKIIVTNEWLKGLEDVGVSIPSPATQGMNAVLRTNDIVPGMEFLYNMHVMRIVSFDGISIRAKKAYKVGNFTTARATSDEVIVYTDIEDVHRRVQQMLE